ncbi:MAG: PAS domain S-box protein [Verrucomicrobia bacterium]|nr:PAS domain S-box protein [Verrucomicrobiota bacterium]
MNTTLPDKNRRVLVIDDNRAIHDDFRKILCPATAAAAALDAAGTALFGNPTESLPQTQFEIDSAYQGQAGVLLAAKALEAGRPYSLAFVDVRMPPGWDSVVTTGKLWELDPSLQVVICTAYSDYSWGQMFEQLGQRDGLLILKKPFDGVEAFQLAHALTEKWGLHQQSRRKMVELESMVAERTAELAKTNAALQAENTEHQRTEEQLRVQTTALDAAANAIVITDHAGTIQWVNRAFTGLTGYTAREAVGQNPRVLRAGNRDAAFYRNLWQTIASGQVWSGELTNRRKDGSLYEEEMTITPLRDADGVITRYVAIKQDVSERKRAEEALRQSEEQFRAMFELAAVGIAQTDPRTGQWLRVNQKMCAITGYSAAELLQMRVSELTHPEDRQEDGEKYQRVVRGEAADYRMEKRYVRKDGALAWVNVNMTVIRDAAGQPARTMAAIEDITERKRAEEALRESKQIIEGILNAIPVRVFWKDKNLVYLGCNAIFARDAGFADPNDIIGKDDYQMGWREQAELYRAGDREIIQSGNSKFLIEEPQTTPEGNTITLLTSKIPLRNSRGEISGVLGTYQDITERKQAEEVLRQRLKLQDQLVQIAATVPGMIYSLRLRPDGSTQMPFASGVLSSLFDLQPKDVIEDAAPIFSLIHPDDLGHVQATIAESARTLTPWRDEFRVCRTRLGEIWVEGHAVPQREPDGSILWHGFVQNITARKRMEAQLFQSQKMETVGKLAGGIAHEFNSILTAILGQSELLLADLPPESPLIENATEISKAAGRAAMLTRQLLAYGRKQFLQPEILDLNAVLAGMESTLRHLMGRAVDVRMAPATGLKAVKADAGQIEQVIMNLAMNAADAMPNGGKLTLETGNVSFDVESMDRYPELKPGDYVMLAITDTGTGMSEEVKRRAFDPFFSTKGVGQGTGLGLSTCYGIIKQSSGHISVYSEPGRGSTFKIYLPQAEPQAQLHLERLDSPDLPRGTETILLVEDDPALREMAATLLRRLGYTVFAVANGVEALSRNDRSAEPIDLLFIDVVMPHMSGKELADRVRAMHPHTRILFTSAYTEQAIVHQGVLDPGMALLQKPFTPSALACKVREILDQPGAPKPDPAQKTFGFTINSGEVKPPGN